MQTLLIVITLGSLAMTIVLAVILVRLIRFERRREAARVALLREMADLDADERHVDVVVDEVPDVRLRDIDVEPVIAPYAEPAAVSGELFVQPHPRSAWPRRAAVATIIAILLVAGALALRRPAAPASAPATTEATGTAAPPQTPALLELLSLKQTQDGRALTITGLVQNPREGAPLSKIVATAMLFGADGTFLASGRAPLDFTTLRPGDESGFVITVPVVTPVARYRVGFRSEDGHVIGHIDRRTASTLATGTASAAVPARGTS